MKITLENVKTSTKTQSEASSAVEGVWVGRSGIGLQIDNKVCSVFGFSSSFNRIECEVSSAYELLENFAFLPSIYNGKENEYILEVIGELSGAKENRKIYNFLNGAPGPQGLFYSNGCAISHDIQHAITHSQYELLERHICCEIWYQGAYALQELECKINIFDPNTCINAYTVKATCADTYDGKFVIAVLDCPKMNFFAFGAAIRPDLQIALNHAVCEVIMLFEDAIRGRRGASSLRQDILSLRKQEISQKRREYFQSLLCKKTHNGSIPSTMPTLQTVIFEPFPGLYAARTFSHNALEPMQLKKKTHLPIMPLF